MQKPQSSALRIAGLFIFITLLNVSCSPQCTPKSVRFNNQIVLQVNEDTLSANEFAKDLANRLKSYDALAVKDESILVQAKRDVVRDFIVKVLTKKWAKSNGVVLKMEELESEIANIRSQYPDDISFRQKLVEENLTFDEWKDQLKYTLLQSKVMKNLSKTSIPPNSEELKAYYDSHSDQFKRAQSIKIQQIVLKTENEANAILDVLKKRKKSLGELAKKFSIAPEKDDDGNLGWIEEGTLEVFDSVFDQPVNRLSGVLKSPYGYHIIKVKDKRRAVTLKFENVQKQIYKKLLENREQAAFSKWLETQIQGAKVLKNEAFIANLKVETRGKL